MLTWNRNLELGVDVLDAQHRDMMVLANEVAARLERGSAPEDVAASVRALADHTARHFRLEEQLMAESGYAHRNLHGEQHGELLDQLERFARRLRWRHFAQDGFRTMNFLCQWVAHHIVLSDRELVDHLAALAPAGAPLPLERGNS